MERVNMPIYNAYVFPVSLFLFVVSHYLRRHCLMVA